MTLRFRFGTAGIRAAMGPADDQLNPQTVAAIAYAIVEELAASQPNARTRGICVGYDGRAHSREFAEEICRVALAAGFKTELFADVVATPLLAFSVRARGRSAGIMVTASHNPSCDNGVKLYLADGGHVIAPYDQNIAARIAALHDLPAIRRAALDAAAHAGRFSLVNSGDTTAYFAALARIVPRRLDLPLPKLAYSATAGVGSALTRALFAELGASQVVEVPEYAAPSPDFAGLAYPNPEAPEALEKLFALSERERVDSAFAHDPDADRLAVLARTEQGVLRALHGDEVGALIGSFLLDQQADPTRVLFVSTHVSGGLLEQIARARGAHFLRTPTGFKWMSALGQKYAAEAGLTLLFGYEEALGYAFFSMAQDKDGVAALSVLCELLRRLHERGESLHDQLDALELTHGVFASQQHNVQLQSDDAAGVLQRLRSTDPARILGTPGVLTDYETSAVPVPLLVFQDANGTRVCVRPSGTEPKLKVYFHVRGAAVSAEQLLEARIRSAQRLAALVERFRTLERDSNSAALL